ncbi:MAG: tetratricopeptide repeat protein [Bacteroidota bacterium]
MLLLSTYFASPDSVPSLRDLERYVSGELSAVEAEAFAEAIAGDPLLADAVEGLKEVRDPQALRKRIKQIQRLHQRRLTTRLPISEQQDERSKRQSRVRPMYIPQMLMGAAAVVLLLVLGFNLFRGFRPTDDPEAIAQVQLEAAGSSTEEEPATESQIAASSAPLGSVSLDEESEPNTPQSNLPSTSGAALANPAPRITPPILPSDTLSEPASSIWKGESEIDPDLVKKIAELETNTMTREATPIAREEVAAEEIYLSPSRQESRPVEKLGQAQDKSMAQSERLPGQPLPSPAGTPDDRQENFAPEAAATSTQFAAEPAKASTQRADLDALTELVPQVQLAVARSHHQAQQWAKAEKELERILIQNPRAPEALFLLGDTFYRQGKIKEAMPYLLRVSAGAEPWYAQAQWTLALCAEAEGKTDTAIRLLKQLAARENFYQVAAQSLLQQWEARP